MYHTAHVIGYVRMKMLSGQIKFLYFAYCDKNRLPLLRPEEPSNMRFSIVINEKLFDNKEATLQIEPSFHKDIDHPCLNVLRY